MMRAYRYGVSTLGLLASMVVVGAANAQTASEPNDQTMSDANNASNQASADDIVVTALKREQLLIDVPQSVTVVGGAALERQQATNLSDYLKLVPGLQLNQASAGKGRLVMRGLNTGSISTTVAVYLDESVFGSSSGLINGATLTGDFDTFDIARVEVLRGPQGTVYGANALGGLIKFVTNAPDSSKIEVRARAGAETTTGGDPSYMANALVNLPVSSNFAVRASGFYRKKGGFIDSIGTGGSAVEDNINGSKVYGGRVTALFKPSENFSVSLSAFLQNIDVKADDTVEADSISGRIRYGRLTHSKFAPEFSNVRYRIYSGTINYDMGFASLISASSYSNLNQKYRIDFTPSYGLFIPVPNYTYFDQPMKLRRFTQEVRLQSPNSSSLEWQIGGYYNNEKGNLPAQLTVVTPGTNSPITALGNVGSTKLDSGYEEIAGFANATVHFGNRFDLTFGGRYSHNSQIVDQTTDGLLLGGLTVFPTTRSSENVFTYSVAPKIKFGERVAIYARVAKGFRPGGPNILPPAAPSALRSYKSDSVISYEAGVKAESVDRSFSIDIAAFHIDWSDIQVFGQVNNFGINFNGGKAVSDGFEFVGTMRPTNGLVVSLNGAYTDAKLKEDTPSDVGGRRGDQLPYTPKWSVGGNVDYDWSLGSGTRAYAGASIRVVGPQTATYDSIAVATYGRQPRIAGYEVVDLRAGVRFTHFSIEVYAKNLGNAAGETSLVLDKPLPNRPLGAAAAGVIRPRTIGFTLGTSF